MLGSSAAALELAVLTEHSALLVVQNVGQSLAKNVLVMFDPPLAGSNMNAPNLSTAFHLEPCGRLCISGRAVLLR